MRIKWDDEWIIKNHESSNLNHRELWEKYKITHRQEVTYEAFRHHADRYLKLKGRNTKWDNEWLMKNYKKYNKTLNHDNFWKAYNEEHKTYYTKRQFKYKCQKMRLLSMPKDELKFIKEISQTESPKKVAEMFKQKFKKTISARWRPRKDGSICRNADNMPDLIKIDGKWLSIARYNMIQAGTPDKNGEYIIHLDGNIKNNSLENLIAVSARIYKGLAEHFDEEIDDPNIKRTCCEWLKLYFLLRDNGINIREE